MDSQRSTIIDVARRAGVSKSTVSRFIAGDGHGVSNQKRQRIQQAIQELGYVRDAIAGSMRTQKTLTIMLAIPDINNPFWPAVARGIQDIMEKEGYVVVFANSDWNEKRESRFLERVRSHRLDGLIINPMSATEQDLKDLGIPIVLLGMNLDINLDKVAGNVEDGIRQALHHLRSLGHQRIGFILGIRDGRNRSFRPTYLELIKESGTALSDDLMVIVPFKQKAGEEAARQLLSKSTPPTALLCENDLLAIGAMDAARELGMKVPEDLSIVGVDNIFAASITTPPLTTVAKPKYELGVQAAKLLLERMNTDSSSLPPRTVVIPCKFLIRGSTRPPK